MIKNIFSIRQGFATNSSSTHFLVYLGDRPHYDSADNFAWGLGYICSKKLKLKYFLSQMLQVSDSYTDWSYMKSWVKQKYNYKFKMKDMESIDHQSIMARVYPFNDFKGSLDLQFYQDLIESIVDQKDVAIEISNDNGGFDDSEEESKQRIGSIIPRTEFLLQGDSFIGKKEGDYWILFNPKDGEKIRLSFTSDAPPQKAITPELVDIKITDMCNSGCKFCYQGSSPTGLHADPKYLLNVFDALETFEVVLGGGDPFEHPDFNEIVLNAKGQGFSVSISTRRYDRIIEEFEHIHKHTPSKVFESLSAIGVSVSSVQDMERIVRDGFDRFYNIVKKVTVPSGILSDLVDLKDKIKFHIVLGTVTREQFIEMISYAKAKYIGVLLLGYKSTGRGCEVQPMDYDWWIDAMQEIGLTRFSIDTSMAKKYAKELEANNVDPRTYEVLEGKFSCYIDAVKQTISKDSYSDEKEVYPLEMIKENWQSYQVNANNIKELFSKF